MTMKRWTVINTVHHENGEVTLTLRDEFGNTLTENYPPGAMVSRVVKDGEADE